MNTFKKPEFRLQKVYSDGSAEEPKLHELLDIDSNWTMGRRGFLITSSVALSALSALSLFGCSMPCNRRTYSKDIINAHMGKVECVIISSDGKLLASVASGLDETIKLWEMPSGKLLESLKVDQTVMVCVALSQDGKLLASGSYDRSLKDNALKLWKMPSGEFYKTLKGYKRVDSVAFSPDGKLLASASSHNTSRPIIKLWEMPSGEFVKTLEESRGAYSVSFSPDGNLLASGSDKTIKLWEMPSGELFLTLKGRGYVAFSPDGKLLASGSVDNTINLWNMPSGELFLTLKGRGYVAFSTDGKLLATGSGDKSIKLWEIPSGKLLMLLEGHKGLVNSVAFSPDGRYLVSGSSDKTIKLWEMPSGKFLTDFLDPSALDSCVEVNQFTSVNAYGQTITYTLPCGSPIPVGAICTCNCVPGSFNPPRPRSSGGGSYGGGSYCSCNKICTCIPIK